MKTNKEVNVVLLNTSKAYKCILSSMGKIAHYKGYFTQSYLEEVHIESKHLYITSDKKIKEHDWIYSKQYGIGILIEYGATFKEKYCTIKYNNFLEIKRLDLPANKIHQDYIYKIIATTDESLNLPKPTQQFIEAYVREYNKGNIIEKVIFECEFTKLQKLLI